MSESMTAWVEVWPVIADDAGIWLISGNDAWRPGLPVMADSEPHAEVELILSDHDAMSRVALLHSTSWRVDGPAIILTYIAVLKCNDMVRSEWSDALPISFTMSSSVGRPPTNAPTEPPLPRYIDVLKHGLRHLTFLLQHDATAAEALTEPWPTHLTKLQPTLAGMYDEAHQIRLDAQ